MATRLHFRLILCAWLVAVIAQMAECDTSHPKHSGKRLPISHRDTIGVLSRAFADTTLQSALYPNRYNVKHICVYGIGGAIGKRPPDWTNGQLQFHLVGSCAGCPVCLILEKLQIGDSTASLYAYLTCENMGLQAYLSRPDSLWVVDSTAATDY